MCMQLIAFEIAIPVKYTRIKRFLYFMTGIINSPDDFSLTTGVTLSFPGYNAITRPVSTKMVADCL